MIRRVPWPWRLALLAIYSAAVWTALGAIENKINPIGWDLQTLETIRDYQQQAAKREGKQ